MATYAKKPNGLVSVNPEDIGFKSKSTKKQNMKENVQLTLGIMPDGSTDVAPIIEEKSPVVDSQGNPAPELTDLLTIDGTEIGLSESEVTSTTIMKLLDEKPKEVLNFLLSKQSNDHPLKKGGTSVAYKCEALILTTRAELSDHENLLFDIILSTVSSRPDDEVYKIYLADFEDYLPYDMKKREGKRYVEDIFAKAKEGLESKMMRMTFPQDESIEFSFHLIGSNAFKRSREIEPTEKSAYLVFRLEPIVKALMISPGYTHGAYYQVGWASQLKSYAKKLFYLLENWKNYKAYPDAVPGVVYVSMEQFRELLCIPATYKDNDIKTKIIDRSIEKINAIEGIDIQVECKTKTAPPKRKVVGYTFIITKINGLTEKKTKALPDENLVERGILQAYSFTEKEIDRIIDAYKESKRDVPFLTQALAIMSTKNDIAKRDSYLCTLLKNGLVPTKASSEKKKTNSFTNFNQREYDNDELERMMLGLPPKDDN